MHSFTDPLLFRKPLLKLLRISGLVCDGHQLSAPLQCAVDLPRASRDTKTNSNTCNPPAQANGRYQPAGQAALALRPSGRAPSLPPSVTLLSDARSLIRRGSHLTANKPRPGCGSKQGPYSCTPYAIVTVTSHLAVVARLEKFVVLWTAAVRGGEMIRSRSTRGRPGTRVVDTLVALIPVSCNCCER